MSKKNPECPVVISRNCPDFRNARVCALSRADKKCFRKLGASRPRVYVNSIGPGHQSNKPRPIRNIEKRVKKKKDYSDYFAWSRRT